MRTRKKDKTQIALAKVCLALIGVLMVMFYMVVREEPIESYYDFEDSTSFSPVSKFQSEIKDVIREEVSSSIKEQMRLQRTMIPRR